jgi:hypothetical protein
MGEQKIIADVETHGWHVIRVFEDGRSPEFAYTVGLWKSFRHPEIIIIGLPADTAHVILNDAGEAIRSGERFVPGMESNAFLEGYPVAFREIPKHLQWPYLGFAYWFYEGADVPAVQLVYPDRESRWPWEQGVSEGFRAMQPVIADEALPSWAHGPDDERLPADNI